MLLGAAAVSVGSGFARFFLEYILAQVAYFFGLSDNVANLWLLE